MSSTKNNSSVIYMAHLDGIRAFAVGGVIIEHWSSGFPEIFRKVVQRIDLGGLGVECFFVLSGFLITVILLNSKNHNLSFNTNLGHFYIRRILRIFPAYYLTLIALFLFTDKHEIVGWHALYLSNLYPIWHDDFPPIGGHFWSLSVEEQFYLFWPFIVLALPIQKIIYATIVGCIIAPLSRFTVWYVMGGVHLTEWTITTTALDLLCFGAFLACLKDQNNLQTGSAYYRLLRLLGLISLFFYVILYFNFSNSLLLVSFGRTLTAFMFGALIITAADGFKSPMQLIFGNRIIAWLGMISYGLYIFHMFIPKIYLYLLDFLNLNINIFGSYYIRYPLLIVLLLLLTAASYYLVERPIREFRKYFI